MNRRRLRRRGESVASLRIREITSDDLPALARLHVTTWNATYAPFGLRGPSASVRERQWREKLARDDPDWFCFVVERADGELVGFAQGNRSDNPAFAGELAKIHLLRDYQRLGIGSSLLGHVVRRFLSRGIASMWLFGDPRNPSMVPGELGAEKTDDDPHNGSYGWRDIAPLAQLPEQPAERR